MKKAVISMILVSILILSSVISFADAVPYEVADGVIVTAELDSNTYDMAVFNGKYQSLNIDNIASMLKFDTSADAKKTDTVATTLLESTSETISISYYDAEMQYLETINYYKTQSNIYSMMMGEANRHFSGISGADELGFMPKQDAIALCTDIIGQLMPGLNVVCADACGYTAADLNGIKAWLLENDEMYSGFCESGKVSPPDEFNGKHEVYALNFAFELDGTHVFGDGEIGLSVWSESERKAAEKMYASALVDRTGIIRMELCGLAQVEGEAKRGQTITAHEAAKIAAERYADVIMSVNVEFGSAYLEYMPLVQGESELRFVPTWCIVASPEGQPNMVLEACRINALTGEVIN